MTATLSSSSQAIPIPTSVNAVSTIELRSEVLARIVGRMHEIPKEVVTQLVGSATVPPSSASANHLSKLILELIHASEVNESTVTKSAHERIESFACSIAATLRWMHESQGQFDETWMRRILLKSLMPLYLEAGQGRAATGVSDTLALLRIACMYIELDRLTQDSELAEWLMETVRCQTDPMQSIPKSFRIAMPKMASVFWTTKAKEIHGNGKLLEPKQPASESQHRAWWSLACQLNGQDSHITVPADLAVGVVAWDRLKEHWKRVWTLLCNSELPPGIGSANVDSGESKTSSSSVSVANKEPSALLKDHRFVEVRSARDPQLSASLDQLLTQCRNEQGILSLLVVKRLRVGGTDNASSDALSLPNWQSKFIEYMDQQGETSNVRGFISDDGELTLVFENVDRNELSHWIRESFSKFNQTSSSSTIATPVSQPLVAGVAMVNAPSRMFKIDQLIGAAWRCLDGATTQGAGAVKTIEVY